MNTISTICVCGAGTMGGGIALVAARAGYDTILFDVSNPAIDKGRAKIEGTLAMLEEKGKIPAGGMRQIFERIKFTADLSECQAGLVIEAIIEDKAAKSSLFNSLAAVNGNDTYFATNTSSISVTEIAECCANPDRVAGMHFFNPAPVMKLVEVVKTKYTTQPVIQVLVAVATQMGKVAVVCNDSPGFIVNRVARGYYLEALKLVEEGLADVETVDAIMEATGFKMGPFKLMDLIGIDVNYTVSNIVWEALGKPERLTPSPLQKAKLDAGQLGNKTGQGFYGHALGAI